MSDLPVPAGWFAVAFSTELRAGGVVERTLGGEELVVWRDRAGTPAAAQPVCPHLGAHLGRATVDAAGLRCPFHGFAFAADGTCTATGAARPPAGAPSLATRPVVEREGAVLVWHDPTGAPPWFEVPERRATASPLSRAATASFDFDGHPVATSENAVDLAHLAHVHRYAEVRLVEPFTTDGPVARASYEMRRPLGLPLVRRLPGVRRAATRVRFDVTLVGLGVSVVDAVIPAVGVRTHQLVLATPTARGRVVMRLAMSVEHRAPTSRIVRLVEDLGARLALSGFVHDVRQDIPIWATQRHLERPAPAHGDGPIVPYRRWARQFLGGAAPGALAAVP